MISSLYNNLPENIGVLLERAIAKGLANGTGDAKVFFRSGALYIPVKR